MAPLARVMGACVLFCIVEYWYWTGVLLFAYQEGGATIAGVVLLVQLIPAALLAAPLGSLGDRLPRGTALSGAYAAQALALAALAVLTALNASLAWVVAASALATVIVSVARPIHHASLPQLAPDPRRLVRANAATGLADGIGVFIGPLLAGVIAQVFGFAAVPMLCAVAMALAALLTVGLHLPKPFHHGTDTGDDTWSSGVRAVSKDRDTLVLLLLMAVAYVVMGSLELINVAFATQVLAANESVAGLLIGAVGIGLFLGSLIAAGLAVRARLSPVIALTFVASGIPLILASATGTTLPAVALLALCGTGLAVSSVAARTLLQRTTDGHILGRVFAVQESLLMLGLAVGAIIGPLCIAALGADGAFVVVGGCLLVAAALGLPFMNRLDRRVVLRPEVLSLLRRVSLLAGLAPPALERLSQGAEWIDVPTGTVVIQQGDHGDAYYVVDTGRLSITKDGVLLGYELLPGEGFGELALLRDAPRSATITALDPCRLLRIERDDFLAAVTGAADGADVARDVEAAYAARSES